MSESSLSRRDFLKLSGLALVATAMRPFGDVPGVGYEFSPHIYQLPEGKVPLINREVLPGDTVGGFADFYFTRYDLIVQANNLNSPPRSIQPGEVIKIPAYAKLPMRYIPEVNIIRHQLAKGDNAGNIAARYGILPEIVHQSLLDYRNLFVSESERVLLIRGGDSPSVASVNVLSVGDGLFGTDVVTNLASRILRSYLYEVGDANFLRYARKKGITVSNGAPRFSPPNKVSVPTDEFSGEGQLRVQLGHELFHVLLFPWWSSGADEGTAGFAACEWATRNHTEYSVDSTNRLWYSDAYYNSINTPELRNRVFGDRGVENRILATKAWQRIEKRFPGVVAHLLVSAANTNKGQTDSQHDPWLQEQVSQWVIEKFGQDAWRYIENQHILFTK